MDFLKYSINLICCSGYKSDKLIMDFCNIFSDDCFLALNSYSSVCERLFSVCKSLREYIFYLAVDGKGEALNGYFETRNDKLLEVFKNDISILSSVSDITSESLILYLKKKFSLNDKILFPKYEIGDTCVTFESVIAYTEKFGTSIFEKNKAFVFENGKLNAVSEFDAVNLEELKNYEVQQKKILDNTLCFVNGLKSQNVLLYGDRGTGKSSTVKAVGNRFSEIRIVQIPKASITSIYKLYELLYNNPLKFILFLDDITFSENDDGYAFLKQVLEGSVVAMPANCIIYATTNRRHIIKETESERNGDEMHAADARDENMSLADRFGLYITFISPNKNEYLDIVKQIAEDRKINVPDEKLFMLAERFALKKCGRTPRTAHQFIDILQSRIELKLDIDIV